MKIYFASLGCDKNLADSEHMLYLLAKEGYEITDMEEEADIFVVNSCCFIADALQESIDTVLELSAYKESGQAKGIIVTGCMAQRFREQMAKELPEVDVIVGTNAIDDIVEAVKAVAKGAKAEFVKPLSGLPQGLDKRLLTTGGHFAYLKIAEGCNKRCSYCIIPSIRGEYRSVPMEELLSEAAFLAQEGVKELILVAQETTLYGVDLYGKKTLPKLLQKLAVIDGIEWIRLLYCYPEEITTELIAEMKSNKKVVPYLDMPIQHASDRVLRSMGRRTNKAELTERIKTLRRELPDICLRTTVICGFPGETEEDHAELLSFLEEARFDRLGAFAYSREENTPAATMPDQIPEETKQARVEEIMLAQQERAFSDNAAMIGNTYRVMVEGSIPEDGVYLGRTYKDAPQVDGLVFFPADREYMTGDFVTVRITEARGYDLIGEIVL